MNSFLSLVLPTTLSSALAKIRPCLFSATHWNMPMSARFKLLIVRTPLFTWTLSCWRQKDTRACMKYLKWSEMKTAQQPNNKQVKRKFEEATEGSCLRCKNMPRYTPRFASNQDHHLCRWYSGTPRTLHFNWCFTETEENLTARL